MGYLGSWKIDDALTFVANTHAPTTGAATDADAVPSYRVYEDETAGPIITGSMALLDTANTAGFYSEQITLSVANGLEKGKSYNVYISATVGGVVGTISHNFQIEAEVDSNVNSGLVTLAAVTHSGATIPTVTTTGTCTTNSDMRGTDSAALASVCTETRLARLDAAISTLALASVCTEARLARLDATIGSRSSHSAADVWTVVTRALTDKAGFTISGTKTTLDGLNDVTAAAVKTAIEASGSSIALIKVKTDLVPADPATETTLTAMKGATFSGSTDSLEAIRDRGDAAWDTATGFSTHSAADVKTAVEAGGSSIASILADTGELQTDWVNGGRLDLLIDAIKAKSDLLTFEATTNFIKSVPQDFNDVSVADATTLTANSAGEIIRKMFWRDSGGNLAVTNATGATSLTKTNGTTEAGTCTVSYNAVSGKTTRTAMTWV